MTNNNGEADLASFLFKVENPCKVAGQYLSNINLPFCKNETKSQLTAEDVVFVCITHTQKKCSSIFRGIFFSGSL